MKILVFIPLIILSSCNVIYKYDLQSYNQLEKKINRNLPKGYSMEVINNFIKITSLDTISFVNLDCLDEFSIAYNPTESLIFFQPIVNCDNLELSFNGLSMIDNRYYLFVRKRNQSNRANNKIIRVVELMLNVLYKYKRKN
jgi:hypothetical protein